ncbi:hypothetical protein [Terrabacter terrigena]|uniref:Uncharacterized protein n=1 Tax=Terrabacter terrigena TaxID=574718 RepID=A0ABW3MYR6_9MICO
MDLLLRVAPQVRLSSSASGLRASLDAGPAAYVGVRADVPSTGEHVSLTQLEQRVRAAHAAEDVVALGAAEETLGSLHLDNHPLRRRPEPPDSGPLPTQERTALQRKAFRAALPQVSLFKWADRTRARAAAETEARSFAQALDVANAVVKQHRVVAVEDQWLELSEHDPATVIAELDAHFAAAECGCTCVDAGWDDETSRGYVTVVGRYPGLDIVGERGPGVSSSGRRMLRRRTRSERNALYLSGLASFALATVRRAISVAVAADDVHVIVVRPTAEGDGLEPIYVGSLSREAVTLRPSLADPVPLLLGSAVCQMQFEGSTHDLVALDPDPHVTEVVRACAEAMADEQLDTLLREPGD